jgi:hypothetical protein
MAIQFEVCINCLTVLYLQFNFAFLFHHSQGQAKKLENGLDARSQPKMRESVIKADDGYLGMHKRTINVGDTKSFIFEAEQDAGQFWMTKEERETNHYD